VTKIHISYEESHRINKDGLLEKKCSKHYIYYPDEDAWMLCNEEFYYKNKSNKTDGLNTWCKRCTAMKSVEWQKENPEKDKIARQKHNKKRAVKTRALNKERRKNGCQLIYQRNNRDKFRVYSQQRQHKNHKITEQEWESCKKYFDYCCAYCGLAIKEHYITRLGITKLSDFHKEHADHFGNSDLSNCIPSCRDCNSSKWKFNMEEWFRQKEFFSEERLYKINQWLNEDYKKFEVKNYKSK
jgi:hypothetical protein